MARKRRGGLTKKEEEIARAIERENPNISKSRKIAIARAQAKKSKRKRERKKKNNPHKVRPMKKERMFRSGE